MSHPAWGAWIETWATIAASLDIPSHPAWGAWIETSFDRRITKRNCRTPPGVRGLKPADYPLLTNRTFVAPRLGCVD